MFLTCFRWLGTKSTPASKLRRPSSPKRTTPKSLLELSLGRESELKSKIRRYVPSQGWTSITYIFKNLAPSLSNVLIESSLKDLILSLTDCRVEGDLVCRYQWYDSSPAEPKMIREGFHRTFESDEELSDSMLPYIPRLFVPLRAVALQSPIDMFTALRNSRFQFLVKFPDKFTVAHCVDDNTIVVKCLIPSKKLRNAYERYSLHTPTLLAVAMCIPSKNAISEVDCLHRIPRFFRRRILNAGFSFSTLASFYPELFVVEREDDLSFSTGIRSKVSDPEKTHPDNPMSSARTIGKVVSKNLKRLEKLAQAPDMSFLRIITTVDDFLQTAMDIQDGKSALRYSRRIGAVRDELIQNEILSFLPPDVNQPMEYDELLLKLTPKVRRQLAFEEGGFRKFVADRKSQFQLTETPSYTRIARAKPAIAEEPKEKLESSEKKAEVNRNSERAETQKESANEEISEATVPSAVSKEAKSLQKETQEVHEEGNDLSSPGDEDSVLSFDNIRNMKVPKDATAAAREEPAVADNEYEEGEEAEDDYLASEVARFVPAKGISGIAVRDLALQIGKDMRKKIRAEGFKTFNEFIEAYPEWFIVSGTNEELYINLKPLEDGAEEEAFPPLDPPSIFFPEQPTDTSRLTDTATLSPFQAPPMG